MRQKIAFPILLALLLASSAGAQNFAEQLIQTGRSRIPTYVASVGAQATTAAVTLSIESSAANGFRLLGWCVGISDATAAAAVTVTVQRRTTASSGGTALTAEGTSTTAISKMNPDSPNYAGIARLGGTPGTAGATLDQIGQQIGELGAGAADPPGPSPLCRTYGTEGGEAPTVAKGVANGLTIVIGSSGAGGLAVGSISAVIAVE